MEQENQIFLVGDESFECKRPTLKTLNDFKTASGFDVLTKKDSPEAIFPDLKNSAKVLGAILKHLPKEDKATFTPQQISDYMYENATPVEFKGIVGFFCLQFQSNSNGSAGADASPAVDQRVGQSGN